MTGLTEHQHRVICDILRNNPAVTQATLFGSRAKGNHHDRSDIDLVLEGITTELEAEAIRSQLEDGSLPQRFDVLARACIRQPELLGHIQRVGIVIYQRQGQEGPVQAGMG